MTIGWVRHITPLSIYQKYYHKLGLQTFDFEHRHVFCWHWSFFFSGGWWHTGSKAIYAQRGSLLLKGVWRMKKWVSSMLSTLHEFVLTVDSSARNSFPRGKLYPYYPMKGVNGWRYCIIFCRPKSESCASFGATNYPIYNFLMILLNVQLPSDQ